MSARTKNFSEVEIKLLLSLVAEYVDILENKSADKVKPYQKEKIWANIEKKFNLVCPEERSAQALKTKYANLKGDLRKRTAELQKTLYESDGGRPVKKEIIHNNSIDVTLKELLSHQSEGNGCNKNLLAQNFSEIDFDEISERNNIASEYESKDESSSASEMWESYTPQLLETKTKKQTKNAKLFETKEKWTEKKLRQEVEIAKKEHKLRMAHMQEMHEIKKKYLIEKHEMEMRILRSNADLPQ